MGFKNLSSLQILLGKCSNALAHENAPQLAEAATALAATASLEADGEAPAAEEEPEISEEEGAKILQSLPEEPPKRGA